MLLSQAVKKKPVFQVKQKDGDVVKVSCVEMLLLAQSEGFNDDKLFLELSINILEQILDLIIFLVKHMWEGTIMCYSPHMPHADTERGTYPDVSKDKPVFSSSIFSVFTCVATFQIVINVTIKFLFQHFKRQFYSEESQYIQWNEKLLASSPVFSESFLLISKEEFTSNPILMTNCLLDWENFYVTIK